MGNGSKDRKKDSDAQRLDEANREIVSLLYDSAGKLASSGSHTGAAGLLLIATAIEGDSLKNKLRGKGIEPDENTGDDITDKLLADLDSVAEKNIKDGDAGLPIALRFITGSIRNASMRSRLDAAETKENAG